MVNQIGWLLSAEVILVFTSPNLRFVSLLKTNRKFREFYISLCFFKLPVLRRELQLILSFLMNSSVTRRLFINKISAHIAGRYAVTDSVK